MLKLLCFVFIFTLLAACDEEKSVSTFVEKKCDAHILGPEIEALKAKLKCRGPVEKTGKVILSFYFDKEGAPQKIRNNFASKNMPDNLQCALNNFREFRSKTQKNCHSDTTFLFTKAASKYKTSLAELNAIILEGREKEHVDLFQDFYQEFGEVAVSENIEVIVPFVKIIPKDPIKGTTTLKILQQLFAPLKGNERLSILEHSYVSKIQMLELLVLYAELTRDEFKKSILLEGDKIEATQAHFQVLTNIQNLSNSFKKLGNVEAPNWVVDYYVAETAFSMAEISSKEHVDWLVYSEIALDQITSVKDEISTIITWRVKKRLRNDELQDGENFEIYRAEETAKMANPLTQFEKLKTKILEHHSKECPSKATLLDHRLVLRELVLGKTKNPKVLKVNFFNDEEKSAAFPKMLQSIAKGLERRLRTTPSCWLKDWEKEFISSERNRRLKIRSLITRHRLGTCLRADEKLRFSIFVDSNGKSSNFLLKKTRRLKPSRVKKLNQCLRKKIKTIRFPLRAHLEQKNRTVTKDRPGVVEVRMTLRKTPAKLRMPSVKTLW